MRLHPSVPLGRDDPPRGHGVVRQAGQAVLHYALACLLAALTLAVPAGAQDAVPRGYGVRPFTPKDFRLPDGAGCSGDIARWQAVQANDYASGNVSLKVYGEIEAEIARASEACAAGRDPQASRMVSASKARHGYPP